MQLHGSFSCNTRPQHRPSPACSAWQLFPAAHDQHTPSPACSCMEAFPAARDPSTCQFCMQLYGSFLCRRESCMHLFISCFLQQLTPAHTLPVLHAASSCSAFSRLHAMSFPPLQATSQDGKDDKRSVTDSAQHGGQCPAVCQHRRQAGPAPS